MSDDGPQYILDTLKFVLILKNLENRTENCHIYFKFQIMKQANQPIAAE